MLSRSRRLTSAQFDRAFSQSQSVRHPLVALKAHGRGDSCEAVRAAFVVPRKQGKAVQRNRARRRLRERYRLHPRRDTLRGCDLIFLSTPATHGASTKELDAALDEVLRRMKRKLNEPQKPNSPGAQATQAQATQAQAPDFSELNFAAGEDEGAKAAQSAAPERISVLAGGALAVIRFYQRFVSPGLPPSCRFYPSCSRYTYGAIERFGLARGLWLGGYRVCRCHPWNAGGIDEVPEQFPPFQTVKARSIAKIKAFFARRRFDSPRN